MTDNLEAKLTSKEIDEVNAEAERFFQALMTDAVFSVEAARIMAFTKQPITDAMYRRTLAAVANAFEQALREPGSVVAVTCPIASETMLASYIAGRLVEKLHSVQLLVDKSTKTRFELSNNSCILVIFGKL